MSKFIIILFSIVMILCSYGFAEDKNDQDVWDSINDTQPATGDVDQTEASLVKLTHFIDLWHKAVLDGDNKEAFKLEQDISTVIMSDIRNSQAYFSQKEKEQAEAKDNNAYQKYSGWNNQKKIKSILKTKKILMGSITRTSSFSNKLRLLGDYQELMRRELDLSRVKLAEDWEDMVDDLPGEQQD